MGAKEECGIAGVYLKQGELKSVPHSLYGMLSQLQHRGQLSAGVAVFNSQRKEGDKIIKNLKEVGKVNDLFKVTKPECESIINYLEGEAGIGHVRYATSGSEDYLHQIEEAQPFLRRHGRPWKRFAIAFNGNISNQVDLREKMKEEGYILDTFVDTELIMHLFSLSLKKHEKNIEGKSVKPDMFLVVKEVMEKLEGAYNVVMIFADGDMIVFRDPRGFRPLVFGENENFLGVASESVALEKIGIENSREVEPGSCIIFNKNNFEERKLLDKQKSRCHFERVYFSRADSFIDNKSVHSTRDKLGLNLAESEPLREIAKNNSDYLVVPVPNTAITAAESFAHSLGLRLSMAITRNETDRGFINKTNERKRIMNKKYGIISEKVLGKKLIVIDDSIVRGETSRKVVALLRNAGASEIHLRSTEPMIKFPCFYGVDFATKQELIANKFNWDIEKNIAKDLGADSVFFQTTEGLIDACGFDKNELCLACVNGEYPTSYNI